MPKDLTPQPDASTGRAVGPASVAPPPKPADATIDGHYVEMVERKPTSGVLWGAARWVGRNAVMPALEKMIPLGASEVAHGLFKGHGFVAESAPMPIPNVEGSVYGPAIEPMLDDSKTAELTPMESHPAPDNLTPDGHNALYGPSYESLLADASRRGTNRLEGLSR